jgi:hypothetical protein
MGITSINDREKGHGAAFNKNNLYPHRKTSTPFEGNSPPGGGIPPVVNKFVLPKETTD